MIGLGYLGATHAVAMAALGHEVIGIEPNIKRLEALAAGKLPFHEPGLDKALVKMIAKNKITFKTHHDEESKKAQLHFLCVGTPQLPDSYAANTEYLFSAIADLAPFMDSLSVVAGKSTVPVGTAKELKSTLANLTGFDAHLAWNPEFLREGTALEDSLQPDRIVIGIDEGDNHSSDMISKCYLPITNKHDVPVLVMDLATSELVKVAANSFLATKISFINAMAEIAEASGADTSRLAEAIGMDARIGKKFLRNGIGFGGGCLPKDIRALTARAEELGVGESVDFLKAVDAINLRRRQKVVDIAIAKLGSLAGKKITMLGATFKPDSDDLRDSPALEIALQLARGGAEVTVHDPVAIAAIKDNHQTLHGTEDIDEALRDSELLILGTEWKQYKSLKPDYVATLVHTKAIIDGRNVIDELLWKKSGFEVIKLGKGS